MKFSICVDMCFSELPFDKRIEKARAVGAQAIEFWRWTNTDIEKIDYPVSIFNLCSNDEALTNELLRGILNAGRKEELLSALKDSLPVYKRLGAKGLIALVGEAIDALPYERQIQNIRDCLLYVKPFLEENDMRLLIEPLNNIDRKNYFMPYCKPLFAMLREIDSKSIRMLYDIYHQHMMGDFSLSEIKENVDLIGHFHMADCPGRHEPYTGEIDYKEIIKEIEKTDFDGYMGFEFRQQNENYDLKKFIDEVRK